MWDVFRNGISSNEYLYWIGNECDLLKIPNKTRLQNIIENVFPIHMCIFKNDIFCYFSYHYKASFIKRIASRKKKISDEVYTNQSNLF